MQPLLLTEVLDIRAELDDEVHRLVGGGKFWSVDAPERAEDVELAALIDIGVVGDEEDEFFYEFITFTSEEIRQVCLQ